MPVAIVPYNERHEEGVRRLNRRLQAAGVATQFPVSHVPDWLAQTNGEALYQEYFVAVDEASTVRGGYILKHQEFLLNGTAQSIADYRLPLSEGVIRREYNFLGLQLLTNALRRQPRLFALGMGGYEHPLPRMLKAARWSIAPVRFFFRVIRPGSFFRNVAALRSSKFRRLISDLLAATGAGRAAIQGINLFRPAQRPSPHAAFEEIEEFSDFADELWEACRHEYPLAAVRDASVLRALYPRDDERFVRLKVARRGRVIGWALLLATAMAAHKQFGNMTVGTIVDCLARCEDAFDVVACAREALEARNVDLIVSNQCQAAWCDALRRSGFLSGPTNFLFAASPKLAREFPSFSKQFQLFHLNRGDGDGPIHL